MEANTLTAASESSKVFFKEYISNFFERILKLPQIRFIVNKFRYGLLMSYRYSITF